MTAVSGFSTEGNNEGNLSEKPLNHIKTLPRHQSINILSIKRNTDITLKLSMNKKCKIVTVRNSQFQNSKSPL